MQRFGHKIILHLLNCLQSVQIFHAVLRVVNAVLAMAIFTGENIQLEFNRVHMQTEKKTLFLVLCLCCGLWCSWMLYIFYFYSDSLPSTDWVIYGSANMTSVSQKKMLLCPHLSSTTICPLLLVSSMMIFSSSGKSICTSFLLEPDERGKSVEMINLSPLTFTTQVTYSRFTADLRYQESIKNVW